MKLEFEQIRYLVELKNKIRHIQLSQTIPASLFFLLKTIELKSKPMMIANEKRSAVRVSDLFDQVHVSRPAMSKCLKECENRGYIHRHNSEKDKRYSYVTLTHEGRAILACADEEVCASFKWIRDQFNEQEKEQFYHLIVRLNDILDEFERKENGVC